MYFDLYSRKSTAALIENKHDVDGHIFSRHVARRTVLYLTMVYVLLGFFALIVPMNGLKLYLLAALVIPLIIWGGVPFIITKYMKWRFCEKSKEGWSNDVLRLWINRHLMQSETIENKDEYIDGNTERNKISEYKPLWFVWWRLVTISPFSIKTLWIWVVIIGIYSAFLRQDISVIAAAVSAGVPPPDNLLASIKTDEFFLDFLRTMMLSIVAYIATNVITDLLELKEEYVRGKNSIREENEKVLNVVRYVEIAVSSTKSKMDDVVHNIKNQGFFKPIQAAYENFEKEMARKYPSRNEKIDKSFSKYSDQVSGQINLLAQNLTGNSTIDLWILYGLNSAEEIRINQIRKNNSITTSFEIFGNIVAACIEGVGKEELKNTEIYTVFALPPNRFLDYNNGDKLSEYWIKYLKRIREAARDNIKIYRHFLSFKENKEAIKNLYSTEALDLSYDKVKERLGDFYLVDQVGCVVYDEQNKRYEKVESEDSRPKKTLQDILVNEYHCKDGCKIIKVDLEKKCKDVLFGVEYKKPIDYFAIKSDTNEWLFCFKAFYDKDLKLAIVEFWHDKVDEEKQDKWIVVKKHLTQLFEADGDLGIDIETLK